MKNPREIKELLIVLRDSLSRSDIVLARKEAIENKNCFGLCGGIRMLLLLKEITSLEHVIVHDFLSANRPRKANGCSKNYRCTFNGTIIITSYWWKPSNLKSRINWLNKQIDKL